MTLGDRLTQSEGWVYMTGMQALVRLPVQQRIRDAAQGLNTGGYISGYRGSPLGTYDINLQQADDLLKKHNIVFHPGLNEDMAATAVWGSQQVGLFPGARVEGVFSIWYGKAPGMDRSMDPIRHANLAGTNEKGGALFLVGDDHGAKSSTLACYSDFNFVSAGMPLLAPANAQEVLDLGLHGIALSRYSSTLVGLKLVTDVVEGGGSVHVAPDHPRITLPEKSVTRPGITIFTPFLEAERNLWTVKLGLALDYARANGLNRVSGPKKARVGIVSAGKALQDLEQALAGMGFADGKLGKTDVRMLKLGMVWPLDDQLIRDFAEGLDTILVIEEKRPLLEDQIRSILYDTPDRVRIVGKTLGGQSIASQPGECAFPLHGEIDPGMIARVLARVVNESDPSAGIALPNTPAQPPVLPGGAFRAPSFCAGCPHGRSTKVIEGSRALAGIGCHGIALLRDMKNTNSISHMGGEGVGWLGQFPFTNEKHVFTNMGDGTYFHSGLLAIRAAIAAKAPITYKLLFNGFVSMTGGQAHDGALSPEAMIAQLLAEGVERIALVADEPQKYAGKALGKGVTLHGRDELEQVQRDLREIPGVTVMIFEQPCATERRRLRKRGKWADPDKRVFINPEVCEGCGDCSAVSQCMAIEPLETEFGRKRQINQSSCNKDFSCLEGFCPSLVTVSGARPRKAAVSAQAIDAGQLPLPTLPEIQTSWAILVSGIGGAGVVTVGQTLAIAAHAAGYFSSNLDITGLAQKYGAVHSHIKIAASPEDRRATRIATGEAMTLIGCDLVVAAGDEALSKLDRDHAVAVTDTTVVPTGEFSKNPDWKLDGEAQVERLRRTIGDNLRAIDAQSLAERVLGDRMFSNMLLVGASWQQGGIPLPLAAIERAIELNGVQIEQNRQAFALGRLAIADPARADQLARPTATVELSTRRSKSLAELIAHRTAALTAYHDAAYAALYAETLARVEASALSEAAKIAVARGLYKLMAVKDPWEVARLYAAPEFLASLTDALDGDMRLTFHLGAWPFGRTDKKTGKPIKGEAGPWVLKAFALMARMRRVRGTLADPFRNSAEARLARQLLADYRADIDLALAGWSDANAAVMTELLDLPEHIRGYGAVRERNAETVAGRRAALKSAIANPQSQAA